MTGVRRAVGDEFHSLATILHDAAWPPWSDPRVSAAIGRIRRRIDEHLDQEVDGLDEVVDRLGLDFEELRRMAADHGQVRRWVSVLGGPSINGNTADVIGELLIVDLFTDELAYIGMLARAIGPAERQVATS
jgi:hypothetical protein